MRINNRKRRGARLGGGWLVGLVLLGGCAGPEDNPVVRVERDEGRRILDPMRTTDLALVFTGSTRGEFEPCGCGGVYEGGFARRFTVVDRIRRSNPNLLLLDTGDTAGGGSASQTEFIFQAYGLFSYDAVALGEGDLRVGVDVLDRFACQYKVPLVCSNLKFNGPTSVRETIVVHKGSRRVGVISVVSDRWLAMLPAEVRGRIVYESPVAAVRRLVPKLRAQCDMVVLLSHLGSSVRDTMSDHLAGVDLWIDNGGHQWVSNRLPLQAGPGGAAVSSPGETNFFPDRRPPLLVSWSNDRKIGVAALKWQGNRLTIPMAEMIELSRGMAEDRRFLEIYDAYRFVSRQELLRLINSPVVPAGSTTRSAAFQYVPSDRCKPCHLDIYRFWKTTPHARAFSTLRKNHRDSDLNCWACHTSGFREANGFDNPATTPELVNVGCQDCHQKDLRTHPRPATATRPAQLTGFQNPRDSLTQGWHCQRCHVPHRSPNFEPRVYLSKVNCTQALKKTVPAEPGVRKAE